MLHRSTLLAILSAVLLLPTAAQAADPVVAGPAPDGSTVTARIAHGSLCLFAQMTPAVNQSDTVDSSAGEQCVEVPAFAPTSFHDGIAGYHLRAGGGLDAGMTGSAIAAVELRKGGRVLAHAATQPSPLAALPNVRFYALSSTEAGDEVAFLDAAGTVVRATDPGHNPSAGTDNRGAPESAKRTIVSGRTAHGGGRWALKAYTQSPIVSTPLAPERRVTMPCVVVSYSTPGHGGGETGSCDSTGREASQLLPFVGSSCGAIGALAGGIVRSGVARLTVVLGDGTARTVPLHAIDGGLRAGVLVLGTDIAVRRIVAADARGHEVDRLDAQLAPSSSQNCTSDVGFSLGLIYYLRALPDTTLAAGAHHLVVADHGADLCWSLDRAPRAPGECTVAPVDPADAYLLTEPARDGAFVAALVPADVAAVRVVLDDGRTRDLPAAPIAGYGGQYAQQVRVIEATLPGPSRVLAYTMLDAAGHALSRRMQTSDAPRLRVVRTIAKVPGFAGKLTLSRAVAPKSLPASASISCLSFGPPPATGAYGLGCMTDYADYADVTSSCATRRTVVTLGLAHRTDRVAIRLASGRERAAHVYPLPAGAHARAFAVVVLGPHDAARTFVRRGRSPRREPLTLPAAADQCGFRSFVDLSNSYDE